MGKNNTYTHIHIYIDTHTYCTYAYLSLCTTPLKTPKGAITCVEEERRKAGAQLDGDTLLKAGGTGERRRALLPAPRCRVRACGMEAARRWAVLDGVGDLALPPVVHTLWQVEPPRTYCPQATCRPWVPPPLLSM